MSLSLWLQKKRCPTCDHYEATESFNYTYNVSAMWYLIYPDSERMIDIDGMTGKKSSFILNYFLSVMEKNPDKFIPLNPENGWGSYESFMHFIKKLVALAKSYPDYIWHSSR